MNESRIPYVLVGGYALALHGIVRATMDIDLVVSLKERDLAKMESLLGELGLKSRIPVGAREISQFHEEYRTKRNLLAWSFVDSKDPTRQVDLLIHPPFRTLGTESISLHGVPVCVARAKDLLRMKRAAGRPQDQIDIQNLEALIGSRSKKKK